MKKLWIALLCSSLLFTCTQQPGETPAEEMATFNKGVVEVPVPNSDLITIRLMFRAGSANDPAGKEGLTNFSANLAMDGGTEQHTKQEIDDLTYPMAVSFNAFTDKEVSVFSTTFHKDNLEKGYDLFRGLILTPRFDQSDFDRLMKSAVNAVTQDIPRNNDEVFSKRALDLMLFENHPYAHLVQGTVSALESMTMEDVKQHYTNVFTRKNLMIGLAGGYDDAFKQRLVDDLGQLPEGTDNTVALPALVSPQGVDAKIVSKDNAFGSAIFMGYPIDINRSSDDFAALLVMASYLGEHRKSYGVLYDKLRTSRSLNYGDYAYVEWYPAGHAVQLPLAGTPRRHNFFSIWIRPVQIAAQFANEPGLEPPELGNAMFCIRAPIRELDMLLENGLTPEDFERTRKFLRGYMKLYIQSASSRLGFLMDSRFYGREDYIGEMDTLMANLTLEQVNETIKKYLQVDNWYVAVITDDSEAEKLAEAIRTNASVPIVYKPSVSAGLAQEIKDEDKAIDAYQLTTPKARVVKNTDMFQ